MGVEVVYAVIRRNGDSASLTQPGHGRTTRNRQARRGAKRPRAAAHSVVGAGVAELGETAEAAEVGPGLREGRLADGYDARRIRSIAINGSTLFVTSLHSRFRCHSVVIVGDRLNPGPSDKPAGWARALRGGRA